ncbi:metalloregulator ArsR/SmtB family transcription factor [Allohahella marinimesophila]|uniref:Metalloregulator ArsR/SmtB family transcription factor n=1 Tax=Allohahella marinimesophila TaxID=1054972 RepID=A0ABP7PSR6_9GAMM
MAIPLPQHPEQPSGSALSVAESAQLFKACGDEIRLQVLRLLQQDTFGVLELSALLGIKQSAMSHHLKVLSTAGLVESQREGNTIFYRRPLLTPSDAGLDESVLSRVFDLVDELSISDEVKTNLSQIRTQRAEQSQAFFARHADDMQLLQERVAEYGLYAEPVLRLIDQLRDPDWQHAIEVGPGEGHFLVELAQRFEQVTAVDNSAAMLEKARQHCEQAAVASIDFRHLDTAEAKVSGLEADLIVMNMVLHHVASPQCVIEDCSAMLKPGGCLIVCDLSHHDQRWTRDACGDLWLGFEAAELRKWAEASGLEVGECLYIGVRNGFQVQVHEFRRPALAGTNRLSMQSHNSAPYTVVSSS